MGISRIGGRVLIHPKQGIATYRLHGTNVQRGSGCDSDGDISRFSVLTFLLVTRASRCLGSKNRLCIQVTVRNREGRRSNGKGV